VIEVAELAFQVVFWVDFVLCHHHKEISFEGDSGRRRHDKAEGAWEDRSGEKAGGCALVLDPSDEVCVGGCALELVDSVYFPKTLLNLKGVEGWQPSFLFVWGPALFPIIEGILLKEVDYKSYRMHLPIVTGERVIAVHVDPPHVRCIWVHSNRQVCESVIPELHG